MKNLQCEKSKQFIWKISKHDIFNFNTFISSWFSAKLKFRTRVPYIVNCVDFDETAYLS